MVNLKGYILRLFACNPSLTFLRKMDKIHHPVIRHQTNSQARYEEAVTKLNSLQSNAAVLEKILKEREKLLHQNITHVEECLHKLGVSINELDTLNVIHITGTKGKGSTSAFCDSILRQYGYRTGFYSSPHLVAVRERIRINGQPISEDMFTSYFWHVYNTLWMKKKDVADMPAYFKFLTVMAYFLFLKEKVDVAIMEVGIGGEYDSTNVIKKPVVCGITSLGLDHVKILGDTLEKIAWQKAGIFKEGVTAFTVPQPLNAMQVLKERAKEIGSKLYVVPSLDSYDWKNRKIHLGLSGHVQYVNASLALQLASSWLNIVNTRKMNSANIKPHTNNGIFTINGNGLSMAPCVKISDKIAQGLQDCQWPGRNQILHTGSVVYFLDGAHTDESIEACKIWFETNTVKEACNKSNVFRILIFNLMGNREPKALLQPFIGSSLNLVIFCPNFAHVSHHVSSDQNAVAAPWHIQIEKCKQNNEVWRSMMQKAEDQQNKKIEVGVTNLNKDGLNRKRNAKFFPTVSSIVLPCISDTIEWISQNGKAKCEIPIDVVPQTVQDEISKATEIHVLVTGSLHLVGGFLSILTPHYMEDVPSQEHLVELKVK